MKIRLRISPTSLILLIVLALGELLAHGAPATRPATQPAVVRCAVIGGLVESGLWPALAERFEKQTGIHIEAVASGPKEDIDKVIRRGGIDLITMHASDTILNLVADGLAADPQPWLRNDLVIVGPPDDPAGIKGETDAAKALAKIAAVKANFVVHSSIGAQEVLRSLLQEGDVTLDPEHTTVLFDDKQRRVLKIAAEKKAYTLVGRIPFRNGKLPNAGMVVVVQGDPRLRRPYLVAVANPARVPDAHAREASRLEAFLRSPETQDWLATFGKGTLDDLPLFFPVSTSAPTTRPAGTLLTITRAMMPSLHLTREKLAAMPHHDLQVKDRRGEVVAYSGIGLQDVLHEAGITFGGAHSNSDVLSLCVIVEAADGYRAVFSLAELDAELTGRSVLLADGRDGAALNDVEGPLRIIVPDDSRPARWVRRVIEIRLAKPD
jgi:tungstate transport system substrate-binding protein